MTTASAIIERVAEFARDNDLFTTADRLAVGFSGGADSTCLLLLMQTFGLPVRAVHFHHHLRGADADADLAWCRDFCACRDIPFAVDHLDVPAARQAGESVEMTARRLRLAAWARRAGAGGAVVALGHHADDVVETFLLRLFRGSGLSGLTGMRVSRVIDGVRYVRPLLCLDRADIEAYLAAVGVDDYRRDRSNRDPDIRRSRIRQELLPVLQRLGGTPGIRTSLHYLYEDAERLEAEAEVARFASDRALPIAALAKLPPALRRRCFADWLRRRTDMVVRRSHIDHINAVLRRPEIAAGRWRLDLHRDWILDVHAGELHIARRPAAPALSFAAHAWDWRAEPMHEIPAAGLRLCAARNPVATAELRGRADVQTFSAAALPAPLLIRPRRPGDRLVPFGSRTPVRLKKLVGNARLPPARRGRVVVLCAPDGDIVWAPFVRRAAAAPVTTADVEAVQIRAMTVDASGKI